MSPRLPLLALSSVLAVVLATGLVTAVEQPRSGPQATASAAVVPVTTFEPTYREMALLRAERARAEAVHRASRSRPVPTRHHVVRHRPRPALHWSTTGIKGYAARLVGSPVQFDCLDRLWTHESHWNPRANNPRSSAYGIAQMLGETSHDPRVQVRHGLAYIDARYGSACGAWAHFRARSWY